MIKKVRMKVKVGLDRTIFIGTRLGALVGTIAPAITFAFSN